ncbi:MAG: indolepyruvate ferredoxin oxidoreductase subunit alpha [Promethearchaeota archaeon]
MKIKTNLCIGCMNCIIVCPVQAISLIDKKAHINEDICVECNVCYRDAECPVNAIKPTRLKWPRVIRSPFSNVIASHKVTGIPGRGTEEMKTNDLTNRYGKGEVGVSIEIGRPGVGTHLYNIELFTERLSKIGVSYEKESPVTALLEEDQIHIKDDIKNENVLSAIIEFKVSMEKLPQVLDVIKEVDPIIDTVFTVGLISRFENGGIPIKKIVEQYGFQLRPNAKINMGLGIL